MQQAAQQRNNPSYSGEIGMGTGVGMDTGNLARAILAVMKSVQYVEKRGVNTFHGYNYATESDVVAALRKGMIENDLIMMPRMHFAGNGSSEGLVDEHGITHVVIEYTVIHTVSGERGQVIGIGSGSDKNRSGVGDKGTFKAITGAHKYALLKLFQIETGDDPERQDEVYDEKKAVAGPPPKPIDDDIEVEEPRDDEPLDDPREDDEEEERERDEEPGGNRALAEQFNLSKSEIKEIVGGMKDGRTPMLRTPAMGDEPKHKWGVVEEIFKQFVGWREDEASLKEWYHDHKRLLSIMEREAPERFKRVRGYFSQQKKNIAYRDKDTRKE